jgi:hypothetical protein
MNSILSYVAAFLILGAVVELFLHLKPVKVKLVGRVTAKMEVKYQKCMKCGAKKKANALKVLKWILIKVDSGTSALIDAIVGAANLKKGDMAASLKSVTMAEVNTQLAKLNRQTEEGD